MFILEITATNYRNVSCETVKFSQPCTFLVGENSLGKTNLLYLLRTIFARRSFDESDFRDAGAPISVTIKLKLLPEEIGFFSDIADPDDTTSVTIEASAEDAESDILFLHKPTGEQIPASMMRQISFFLFETLNANNRELNYDQKHGVGRVLSRGLGMYQQKNGMSVLDFFDQAKLDGLIAYLNSLISKISLLAPYGVHAGIDKSEPEILGSIVTLTDINDLHFRRSSSGVQYIALAVMQILDSMMRLSSAKMEKCTFTNPRGERVFSAILAFDEPEAHLHPYMQRTLTKYLCSIASGEEDGFNELLKEYFDIDRISAQVIVVTHSPSIISSDYNSIVRFGQRNNGTVSISCGTDLTLGLACRKQIIAQFDSIKEAFFSRGVLVVEGVAETTAIRGFAFTEGIDLDSLGLILVAADGKKTVPTICDLFGRFDIPVCSIVDKDAAFPVTSGSFVTTSEIDLEAELVESLFASNNQATFITLLENYESQGRNCTLQADQLKKKARTYNPTLFASHAFTDMDFSGAEFDGAFPDGDLTRLMMYTWLSWRKGAVLGTMIGNEVPSSAVPQCYVDIVNTLMGMAL
ncbi:ATP-dependent nuclease [Adlercreutzia muris]|uniref:ATP-dependent nuclease n=1 Tax=Adlercreutzia muris TaxID=1796610 RepID=UPI0035185D8C